MITVYVRVFVQRTKRCKETFTRNNSDGYPRMSILETRAQIRKDAINNFKIKGGENFKSMNSTNVEFLFDLYDRLVFENQIREKVQLDNVNLNFYAKPRTSGPGGITGTFENEVYIDIAPNVLNSIFKRRTVQCKDRLECLMLIMEHQIIHLLMILWGFSSLSPTEEPRLEEIYGVHGKLFQCLLDTYFGHKDFNHDLGLTDIYSPISPSPEKQPPSTGYGNWSNSCYIDSVIMIILENVSPFWRRSIFNSTAKNLDFTNGGRKKISKEKLETLGRHAENVRDQLAEDYKNLHEEGDDVVECRDLRGLLKSVAPEMKENGRWIMFNAGALYEALVATFPNLLIDVPVQMHRWSKQKNRYVSDTVQYQKEAMLTMWDFMDPLTDRDPNSDYKEIRWDLCESPILVFTNSGLPRIKHFDEKGEENGSFYIEGQKHEFSVNKKRQFGAFIIGDRYELVGVVVLHGVKQGKEGGSHYTSYFKGRDLQWYEYDDMGPSIEGIPELPKKGVWVEQGGQMPSLYFYQRVDRKIKTPVKAPTPVLIKPDVSVTTDRKNIKIKRVTRYDGFTMFFAEDKTSSRRLIPEFKKIELGIDEAMTVVSPVVVFWRIPTAKADNFEAVLLKLGRITAKN